ncbi:hypothetical protein ACFL6I_19595 [candidate division KSB1 bacterium]
MVEFNEDGSLRLPDNVLKKKQEKEDRLKKGKCMLIKKDLVSFTAPKKCILRIRLSDAITDNRFIETTYKYFSENAKVPSKLIKINEKEFDVEIGTDFRRCSDCTELIKRFNEFLYGNIIEEKGNCSYGNSFRKQDFSYEDYFE